MFNIILNLKKSSMWLKEMLNKEFNNEKTIIFERYKASKFVLVVSSFLFFLNFYFVWANFYSDIFKNTLNFIFIILIISLIFYFYFFIKNLLFWKIPQYVFIIIFIFLLILFLFLLLPIIVEWWLIWIINFIKLYL